MLLTPQGKIDQESDQYPYLIQLNKQTKKKHMNGRYL